MAGSIKVVMAGALGRMGREVVAGLASEPDIEVAGGVDPKAAEDSPALPQAAGQMPLSRELQPMIERVRPRVVVDFTVREAAVENALIALRSGVSPVIGTSGLTQQDLGRIAALAEEAGVGAVVAPNFAVGANLMIHFARIAARFMPAAEIIELHHDGKVDAPSGTAASTARAMREARGADLADAPTRIFTLDGVRGGVDGGVRVHSVRLPGLVAHQEVIFGERGQMLTIRHDSLSRESFIPGVVLAVRAVVNTRGLVYGLDKIMGLEQ